jgi:hypothetical protein
MTGLCEGNYQAGMAAICPAQPSVLQCSIQKPLAVIASIDDIIFGAGAQEK